MSRTLHIHIGAHKTATTMLQAAFLRNAEVLAENGVLYPETNRLHFAHHRLPFALRGRRDHKRGDVPDFDIEIAALRKAIERSSQRQIFISSEEFFVSSAKQLRKLHRALNFTSVIRIIASIRRQDDYLLSVYNQNSKTIGNGFTRPLPWYVENPRTINREISFLSHLEKWRDEFGADSVSLLRYEDGEPLATMLGILGLPKSLIKAPERHVNQSMPSATVETVRLAKRLGLSLRAQSIIRSAASRVFAGWPKGQLTDAQRARIIAEFTDENERLFAAFGMTNTYRLDMERS